MITPSACRPRGSSGAFPTLPWNRQQLFLVQRSRTAPVLFQRGNPASPPPSWKQPGLWGTFHFLLPSASIVLQTTAQTWTHSPTLMNHTATQTRRLWAEIPWRSAKINPTLRKYVYMRLSLKSKRPRLPFLPRSLHVKHEALQTHASGSHPSFSPHQLIIKRSGTDTPTPSAEASPAVGSCVWDPALNLVPSVYAHTQKIQDFLSRHRRHTLIQKIELFPELTAYFQPDFSRGATDRVCPQPWRLLTDCFAPFSPASSCL